MDQSDRDRSVSFLMEYDAMATNPSPRGESIQRMAGNMERELRNLGEQAQDRMSQWSDVARLQAREWEQSLAARIREKPLGAVVIAAGVGLLIGILRRR
jgi:ElaB/YqjD/DUF883 family membrane-anchored ribosome-binding protein